MKLVIALLASAVGLLFSSAVSAHSFDVVFVVPVSGPQSEAGKQARDGFMFAARERDGHPNETADGHLGGLDVHLLVVDSTIAENNVTARVHELAARAADDSPWIVAPEATMSAIERTVSGADFVAIDLSGETPWEVRTMDGGPFRTAFEKSFGYLPTQAVIAGYGAARKIDKAVRARN